MSGYIGRSFALAVLLSLVASPLLATQWTDPSFEEMVAGADLIAVVEIVEGGKFRCTARATDVLKGKAPEEPFSLGGFNNEYWPERGIEKESMREGDRLLAFLHAHLLPEDHEEGEGEAGEPSSLERQRKTIWLVPTPSTGDLRIIDGKIHGGWYSVSYPSSSSGVDAALVLTMIRGYLLHLENKEPVEAKKTLEERLALDLVRSVTDVEEETNYVRVETLGWLLCAQATYGGPGAEPVVFEAAQSKAYLVRVCGARALRSLRRSTAVLECAQVLLLDPDSFVEAESVRSLLVLGYSKAELLPLLLKALPTSSGYEDGPQRVMDPLLNTRSSGREMMVRAITQLGAAKEAHDALVGLIQDDELTEGVLAALSDHFLEHPSPEARSRFLDLYRRCPDEACSLFHRYLLEERSSESLQAVADKILKLEDRWARFDCLRELARAIPGSPLLSETVLAVLKLREPDVDFRIAVVAASDAIQDLLDSLPTDGLDEDDRALVALVRDAVRLKLSEKPQGKERVDAWIRMIRLEAQVAWVGEYLSAELVRGTPPDLHPYAVDKLREIPDEERTLDVLKAIGALGGTLSTDEALELRLELEVQG